MNQFLPVCREDMLARGWQELDFLFVSGDAYVDHPSFAAALVGRVLEAEGYRVGILAQPDIEHPDSLKILGTPRLGVLVSAGNMDSMVSRYTANKKPRSEDLYSPGGKVGLRPDRTTLRYVSALKAVFKGVPVIIGGIEASLRRMAHYDYWSDTIRRSILADSKADILVYGMGERPVREVAARLAAGDAVSTIRDIRGTCVMGTPESFPADAVALPSYEEVRGADEVSKRAFAEQFMLQRRNSDALFAKPLVQQTGERFVIQNPAALPLSQSELDAVYELPFTKQAHPIYASAGGIPALQEVEFSLLSSRGCYGGCSFCAITFHQGRAVRGRSQASLEREARALSQRPGFKGYIHDVGGPTANFRAPACETQEKGGACPDKDCLSPEVCTRLRVDHAEFSSLLQRLRSLPKMKKVFVRSGIRFDYVMLDTKNRAAFMEELCRHHVSGQLKVAPEHVSDTVLAAMGKCGNAVYQEFSELFEKTNKAVGLKQYLIPYVISAHPGSGLKEALELALYLKQSGFVPDQAQDYYPTPGTLSTVMYCTGLDPRDMSPVYVARGERERKLQRALIQYDKSENHALALEALRLLGREDLIGDAPGCLIPWRPRKPFAGKGDAQRPPKGKGATEGRPSAGRPPAYGKGPTGNRPKGGPGGSRPTGKPSGPRPSSAQPSNGPRTKRRS